MKRLLLAGLLLALAASLSSCGAVFVGGFFNPNNTSTITGTVNLVQLGFVTSGTNTIQVTFVTLLVGGTSSFLSFCGDQSNQFPLNQQVTTRFSPGQPCATIITVVIIT